MPRNPHRYLLAKVLCNSPVSGEAVERAARSSVEHLIGRLGAAEIKARMIGFKEEENKAVFRCDLDSIEKLRAALALMTHVNGNPVAVMTMRSAGTIKSLSIRLPKRRR